MGTFLFAIIIAVIVILITLCNLLSKDLDTVN